MKQCLAGKRILLGVTGSIAAYKSAELVRRLREAGAVVRVVMTENAKRFITALTMQAVSGYPVHDDLFDERAEAAMGHIELARWADAILIAPATADCMARLANGKADDLLTTLCLATPAPVIVAPAMNQGMWRHAATQTNIDLLKAKGIMVLDTAEGSQACGDVGPGRLLEPADIVKKISEMWASDQLAGLTVLITAGPTHEAIDPVRFITNGSSGKMGYALAEAARVAGARVILVSGPVTLPVPLHVECMSVTTGVEMYEAVMKNTAACDIFIAAAAVGDYRSQQIATQKRHKDEASITLQLERNPDIVASVGQLSPKPFIVGFAAETNDVIASAKAKRQRKNMDMIVANRVGKGVGMGVDENEVTVIGNESETTLPLATKHRLARQIIRLVAEQFNKQGLS